MSFITSCSFVFNGINSHDYGVVIGWLDSSSPDVSINGLNREIKKTTNNNRIKSNIYGTDNIDVITFNFGIFKINGGEISRPESIKINQWLMSSSLPQLLKFNDCDAYPLHYYAVCTKIEDVIVGGRLVGKELTFETNSPYAFTKKEEKIFKVGEGYANFYLNNPSENIYYPTITITTVPGFIVTIENVTDKKAVIVRMPSIWSNLNPSNPSTDVILNSEKMTVLDKNNNLIPANYLGWNDSYKCFVPSTDKYMNNIYWVRLLKGMNEFKIYGDCTIKITYEYPRKAGCL